MSTRLLLGALTRGAMLIANSGEPVVTRHSVAAAMRALLDGLPCGRVVAHSTPRRRRRQHRAEARRPATDRKGAMTPIAEIGLDHLDRERLATLVPEYLLAGHLIDRASMPHVIGAFGRDVMRDIAIEEWMGASPVYTKRMQRRSGSRATRSETIFKGMQIDVGAPPQFMDFPVPGGRPRSRRVLVGPLRGPDGRGADGPRLRKGHVPRHRGPDLRGDGHGQQPEGTGPTRPPASRVPSTGAALPLDGDHRRVAPGAARPTEALAMADTRAPGSASPHRSRGPR